MWRGFDARGLVEFQRGYRLAGRNYAFAWPAQMIAIDVVGSLRGVEHAAKWYTRAWSAGWITVTMVTPYMCVPDVVEAVASMVERIRSLQLSAPAPSASAVLH